MQHHPIISIIAAIAKKDRGIGYQGKLLWHIPEDLKRFKELTKHHVVIMGRKTYESIGHALPYRTNIVITSNPHYKAPGCIMSKNLTESIEIAKSYEQEEIFVIGGGQIYAQALPLADKLYLTIVEGDYIADTFFPEYENRFKTLQQKLQSRNTSTFVFETLKAENDQSIQ